MGITTQNGDTCEMDNNGQTVEVVPEHSTGIGDKTLIHSAHVIVRTADEQTSLTIDTLAGQSVIVAVTEMNDGAQTKPELVLGGIATESEKFSNNEANLVVVAQAMEKAGITCTDPHGEAALPVLSEAQMKALAESADIKVQSAAR